MNRRAILFRPPGWSWPHYTESSEEPVGRALPLGIRPRSTLRCARLMDSFWLYPVLFLTGLVAGFVDSIAGGGGLISIPVFLNLGLPPLDALGTNKLQACFGSGSATWHFSRAGLIDGKGIWRGVGFTFLGATAGTIGLYWVDPNFLKQMIPWLLVVIALYLLLQRRLGDEDVRARWGAVSFYAVFGLTLGFYDGFFGPGTGTFWAMAFLLGLGFNLTRATAHTKLMNFTSNIASLLVFLPGGHIHYLAGLTMGAGQWLGAQLGARVVIRRGTRFIRPVFITVVLAITAKLLYQNVSQAGH